jgi:hypothetical protein
MHNFRVGMSSSTGRGARRRARGTGWARGARAFAALICAICIAGTGAIPPSAAAQEQLVPDEEACPACEIVVTHSVSLGEVDGPGALSGFPRSVASDSQGRFWVVYLDHMMVFSQDGSLEREVGRQGQGPGEFQDPVSIVPIADSMLVLDQNRMTVYGPSLEYVRTLTLPLAPDRSMGLPGLAVIQWPDRVVLNGLFNSPELAGWPLHLIDASGSRPEIIRSFGSNGGVLLPRGREEIEADPARGIPRLSPKRMLRYRMSVGVDGRLTVGHSYEYRIEAWDPDGEDLVQLRRQPEWFPEREDPRAWRSVSTSGRPADPFLRGLRTDREGLLWAIHHVPGENVEPRTDEPRPQGPVVVGAASSGDLDFSRSREASDTMIEILDLGRREVIARRRLDTPIDLVLGDGRLVAYAESDIGVPRLDVFSVTLVGGR